MAVNLNKGFIFNNLNNFGNKITIQQLIKKRWQPFIGETFSFPVALQNGAKIVIRPGGVVFLRATPITEEEENSDSFLKYKTADFKELAKALNGVDFAEEDFLIPRKQGVEVNNIDFPGTYDNTEVMISHAPTSVELATTTSPSPAGTNAGAVISTNGLKWYKKAYNNATGEMRTKGSIYPTIGRLNLQKSTNPADIYFYAIDVRGGGWTLAEWAGGYFWNTWNSSGSNLSYTRQMLLTDTSISSGVSQVSYPNLDNNETININQFEPANFKVIGYICAGVL